MVDLQNNKIIKIFNNLIMIVTIPIIIVSIFVVTTVLISKANGNVPRIGNISIVEILSNSMKNEEHDEFDKGKKVVIRKTKTEDLNVGDIIAFYEYIKTKNGEEYSKVIFHRIVEIKPDINGEIFFITKGDKNTNNDPYPVHNKYVIGKYEPGHQTLIKSINFLTSVTGIVILVIFPSSIMFFLDTIVFIRLVDESVLRSKILKAKKKPKRWFNE